MLPYVALILPAVLGFSLLAVDAARYSSLQTQMQAAADALALAGARELDKETGAQARAISAMANTSLGNTNTLFGMGSIPTFTYTYAFYQSLPAATANLAGATVATTDFNSKYVSVTVTPVTIPTIFPVKLIMPSGVNSFSAGAQAVAGFQGVTVCGAAPVFMCNPWETNGMTDAQATQTLYTNALNPTFQRHQFKFLRQDNNAGPGHFGWVNPPNGGNSTPGMEQWAASTYGACYSPL
jgi:hypothetical protein